jgi:hypothetical protein
VDAAFSDNPSMLDITVNFYKDREFMDICGAEGPWFQQKDDGIHIYLTQENMSYRWIAEGLKSRKYVSDHMDPRPKQFR